jgi:glycogen synthase
VRVSVVICTYNRADGLRQTLECLRRQRYDEFEVVVVNGPSTDHTETVLAEYRGQIKLGNNPLANLSVSRNIGIRAAAGDIVAFIDDDALPEADWLTQALEAFDDPQVGGVGGIVLDHTGMDLQYRFSAANRFGEGIFSDDVPFDDFSVPGSWTFPYLQGTNALFRRSVLAQIGLFDETYDYYLDETDLCLRIVDAGYVLRQLTTAPVHHKYLPSAVRNQARIITNWYPVVKNFTYFGYRHALYDKFDLEVIDTARAFIERLLDDTRLHIQLGNLPDDQIVKAIRVCGEALAEGIRLGRQGHDRRLAPATLTPAPFAPYPKLDMSAGRRLVLVSSGYADNLTGGIARFITDVAPALAARGHDVRVFTATTEPSTVDLENGVWVHRLAPAEIGRLSDAPTAIDGFATAVADELLRIAQWWKADAVYGSLWDVELLGIMRDASAPTIPMLATPTAEVATHEGWDDPGSTAFADIKRIIELESELVAGSAGVHAISEAIVDTFERLYPDVLDRQRTHVAHIGRADEASPLNTADPPSVPLVFFVGRLEPRKGIDVLLDAAATVLDGHPTVRFVIAGDARRPAPSGRRWPDEWRTRHHPADDRVEFVGMVSDERLAQLIGESTVVVMPSRYESFGLVVAEAMMHGRPSIASDIGGLAELVVHEETGLLVTVDDADALAAAILRVVNNPAEAAVMGRQARERFESDFSMAAATARLERVIATTLAALASPVAEGTAIR